MAASGFKHGRDSRYLPARYHEAFAAAQDDETLLSLTRDLAQVESRLAELHQRLDSGETGDAWTRARETFQAMTAAQEAQEFEQAAQFQHDLGRTLAGSGDTAAWREILTLIEHRRRLVETETRATVSRQELLRADELKMLMVQLSLIVREHVHDHAQLVAIANDFARLTGPLVVR